MIRGGLGGDRPATVTRISAAGQRVYVVPDDSDNPLIFRHRGDGYYCIGDESATLDFSESGA